MNYLFYGNHNFSLSAIHAIDNQAKYQLLSQPRGNFGMKGESTADSYYIETEVTGLTAGNIYTLNLEFVDIISNSFDVFVNENPNDNSNPIVDGGWGEGKRSFTFVAPSDTVYVVFGDAVGGVGTYFIVDNVSLLAGSQEMITNGTFETDTSGWYVQTGTDGNIVHYEYNPIGDNPYLKPVDIPDYDSSDSTHCMIPDDEPFESATFNNTAYSHYYVRPGTYSTPGEVQITRSGTEGAPLTIALYNGNDLHPGELDDSERAYYSLHFVAASWWIVDRPSYKLTTHRIYGFYNDRYEYDLGGTIGSTNNVINRSFSTNTGNVIFIANLCDNNTIQHGYFDTMPEAQRENDIMCILIQHNTSGGAVEYVEIKNTVITENEAKNQNDFVHIARLEYSGDTGDLKQAGNMEGTTVAYNKIWMEDVPYVEQAIDHKIGSENPDNPVIIRGNVMWGYMYKGANTATIFHHNNHNIVIDHNIGFQNGKTIASGAGGFDIYGENGRFGILDGAITDNLTYECGQVDENYNFNVSSSVRTAINNNVVINCLQGYLAGGWNDGGCTFSNNDVCNTPDYWWDKGGNDAAFIATVENDNSHYITPEEAGYTEDIVITYDEYIGNPKTYTLVNAAKPGTRKE